MTDSRLTKLLMVGLCVMAVGCSKEQKPEQPMPEPRPQQTLVYEPSRVYVDVIPAAESPIHHTEAALRHMVTGTWEWIAEDQQHAGDRKVMCNLKQRRLGGSLVE